MITVSRAIPIVDHLLVRGEAGGGVESNDLNQGQDEGQQQRPEMIN